MRAAPPRALVLAPAALVSLAALVLFLLGRAVPTPWILIDELLHGELARNPYSVRGHHLTVSWTYPLLLHPFASSYAAMKAVNAVVISLTAVPVFLWARRLVSDLSALAACALTLVLPSLLFSSTLMLENLFLPAFVLACFLCALALEKPAWQWAALAAIAFASATRVQGLILVPVFAASALSVRRVRALAPALGVCALASVAVLVKLAAGGLGVYEHTRSAHYAVLPILGWLWRSFGELSLALGVVPVAALLALRPGTLRERAFVAVTAWTTAALLLLAAASASWTPPGLKERYMLECMPLLLLAMVVWLERGAPRRWLALVPALAAVALPFGRLFREESLLGNAWGLIPFERSHHGFLLALVGCAVVVLLVQRAPWVAAVGVGVFLFASTLVVWSTIRTQSRAVLALSGLTEKRWLAGRDAVYVNLTAYEQGATFDEWVPVWETEFWNRSFRGVLTVGNADEPAPFFQEHVPPLDWKTGVIGGTHQDVIFDNRFRPAGVLVASSGRLSLYDTGTPLRLASAIEGVYADGTTTGLAAYTCWTQCAPRVRVVAEDPAAKVTQGAFAALPGGGGRIARQETTLVPPYRVEVRARPGSRVRFLA